MPKENTHLYFAHHLHLAMEGGPMKDFIGEYMSSYLLGAIAPDILFYSRDHSLIRISESLHGITGEPTNTVILDILEREPGRRDLAFLAGYISHCVLDIVFHPVIYFLSGNYYDTDPEKNIRARYMHRYLETRLDIRIDSPVTVRNSIRPEDISLLLFSSALRDRYGLSPQVLTDTLKRQAELNRLFRRRIVYYGARLALRERENLGLFYAAVKRRNLLPNLEGVIEYRDILSGENLQTSYMELLHKGQVMALDRINAIHDYHAGNISEETLRRIIPGESLDTGRMGLTAKDIRYTVDSGP